MKSHKVSLYQNTTLLAAAVASSVGVVALAIFVPLWTVSTGRGGVQPRHSLVHVFGWEILPLATIPLLVSLIVTWLLLVQKQTNRRWPSRAAALLAGALVLAAVIGFLTFIVGIFVIPTAVFLVLAIHPAPSQKADGKAV